MTAETQSTPAAPPALDEPAPAPKKKKKSPGKAKPPKLTKSQIEIGVAILVTVAVTYALSLVAAHLLQREGRPLPALDLSQGGGDATIVQLRVEELKPVTNRLTVNVLVYPGIAQYDPRFDVLGNDVAVRLYPTSDLGDLNYPKGKAPAQLTATIEAHGNPRNWPFDKYKTEPIAADAFVGSGDNRRKVPALVEVTGALDGWNIDVERIRDPSGLRTSRSMDTGNVVITLERAEGPLIFDLVICLVLMTLPTIALIVAIPMAMGRRKFVPPFGTWYAAMLFAVVPLRNILPGSPPPGSWIDQALVQWVLLALVTAMSLYFVSWIRQGD
ncbi:DUF4436 domain-containing protein [Mycobacterium sp.]|uniref:DUF4436 domain-containing protein n=1 Tax=Mycobacterium sp. TaxID=1785 RepID=UPI002BF82BDE|nr:DUF4436 domain-containing protein [Mycobacterium sp.]HTY32634.1 DUF4436 domain-containing protein [Mycobacterium sp.]